MFKKTIAACALSTVALGAAACGTAQAAPPSAKGATATTGSATTTGAAANGGTPGAGAPASASAAATASAAPTKAAGGTTTGSTGASKKSTVPACDNDDLKIYPGYGTQSQPLQEGAVVFKNISTHTCTLQGYPGAAIEDSGTVINATRVLNGDRGDLPQLTSPPLVTLAPGGVSYSVIEYLLHTDQSCYPNGTGTIEITAPNTTKTIAISTGAHLGTQGICSAFEVNPVVPGTFGVSVGG
ncbi:DUF4232 domain-containing protein [Actinospica sp. MGRD01-02]|uniref:DUF4232 domain-containing protein n=1 Tax=Actinospica acidithermotolerans TaxID=2828514 RepID=A0A941E837_9ACTN|nr:DUF4232 domain-containing protein [Actinospica acidithermotolerans]MBR7825547.1 DUF4232 domain-containing protein [Actinospica acidithermotolerans]